MNLKQIVKTIMMIKILICSLITLRKLIVVFKLSKILKLYAMERDLRKQVYKNARRNALKTKIVHLSNTQQSTAKNLTSMNNDATYGLKKNILHKERKI